MEEAIVSENDLLPDTFWTDPKCLDGTSPHQSVMNATQVVHNLDGPHPPRNSSYLTASPKPQPQSNTGKEEEVMNFVHCMWCAR